VEENSLITIRRKLQKLSKQFEPEGVRTTVEDPVRSATCLALALSKDRVEGRDKGGRQGTRSQQPKRRVQGIREGQFEELLLSECTSNLYPTSLYRTGQK
jgi:hypothetical protein